MASNKIPAAENLLKVGLATSLAGEKKYDEAIQIFDEIAASDEESRTSALYEKALLLVKVGKTEEAKKVFHKIIEDDPKTPHKSDVERRLASL